MKGSTAMQLGDRVCACICACTCVNQDLINFSTSKQIDDRQIIIKIINN